MCALLVKPASATSVTIVAVAVTVAVACAFQAWGLCLASNSHFYRSLTQFFNYYCLKIVPLVVDGLVLALWFIGDSKESLFFRLCSAALGNGFFDF